MGNQYELNINLNNTTGSEAEKALNNTTKGSVELNTGKTTNDEKSVIFDSVVAHTVVSKAVNFTKKVASSELSKMGTIYGDVARENEISNIVNTSSSLAASAISVAASFAVNPVLGTINLINTGLSSAYEMFNNYQAWVVKETENNINSNKSQERLGNLASSRGR